MKQGEFAKISPLLFRISTRSADFKSFIEVFFQETCYLSEKIESRQQTEGNKKWKGETELHFQSLGKSNMKYCERLFPVQDGTIFQLCNQFCARGFDVGIQQK